MYKFYDVTRDENYEEQYHYVGTVDIEMVATLTNTSAFNVLFTNEKGGFKIIKGASYYRRILRVTPDGKVLKKVACMKFGNTLEYELNIELTQEMVDVIGTIFKEYVLEYREKFSNNILQ